MEIEDKDRERAAGPQQWLLRLQHRSRLSPLGFGLLAGILTFALVMLPVAAVRGVDAARDGMLDGALFFAATIGVLAGFAGPVFRGARDDLLALGPVLPFSPAQHEVLVRGVTREPRRETLRNLSLGVACGLGHSWIMATHRLPPDFALSQFAGTLLVWLVMWSTMAPLISNAAMFSALGAVATPDLLRPSRHAGFGRAALRPALFVISLLCAYPILAFGGGLAGPALVGFSVTLVALFGLFFLPLIGIRRRIRLQRQATLQLLDERIDSLYTGDIAAADAARLFEIDAVLDIRERVQRASAWPLDLDGLRRIGLYIILPPLTWAAAALVEMLIDRLL